MSSTENKMFETGKIIYVVSRNGVDKAVDKIVYDLIEELQTMCAAQAAALQAQSEEIARLRGFVRDLASDEAVHGHLEDWIGHAKELVASWESDSDESVSVGDTTESEAPKAKPLDWVDKDVIKVTGVPIGIRRVVTKNHETMATFQVMGKSVVAFPRTWQGYQHKINAAYLVNLHLPFLLKEDNRRDEMQYILVGIEGIDPETWGAESNESED